MTVLVRPIPRRIAGNRVVPFRQVQTVTKVRPVSLADWKPPVPEPLPPAPLLGLGTLALLGLQAIAYQVWGLLNPNRRKTPAQNNTTTPDTILQYQPGTALSYEGKNEGSTQLSFSGYASAGWYIGSANNNAGVPYTDREPTFFYREPAVSHPVPGYGVQNYPAVRWYDPRDGQTKESWLIGEYFSSGQKITIRPIGGNSAAWLPFSDATTVEALNLPELIPDPEPAATPPVPLPVPMPSTAPQPATVPEADPLTEPVPLVPVTPGPAAPPAVKPSTPYRPLQPTAPAAAPIRNGATVAAGPVPVPTTPQDAIFPVPGGLPVTGRTLAPTLQAVASEVGRIEQKIDRMLNPDPGQWGDGTDRLQLFRDLLLSLYNSLTDGAGPGSYALSSPCVVDEDGVRVVSEVAWPSSDTNHGAILARVDAIAGLLQVHKDLKQPNCHIPPVVVAGEFVTVNFEQID